MHLIVKQKDGSTREFQFTEGPVSLGRAADSSIFLPGRTVSRQHATIFLTDEGKWIVKDLDSTSKTYLNDGAVHKAEIKTGDCIRITDFTIDWLTLQIEAFPSIDGIFLLDDIVGFIGENDFKEFAFPYLKKIYDSFNVNLKMFHNDAPGLICAPFLKDIGINIFNFSHDHPIDEMRKLTGDSMVLLGNIPPRDVMALGNPEDVKESVDQLFKLINSDNRIIYSCGGGMPQEVTTENIQAFIDAVLER